MQTYRSDDALYRDLTPWKSVAEQRRQGNIQEHVKTVPFGWKF
jgi:hypothetical protein